MNTISNSQATGVAAPQKDGLGVRPGSQNAPGSASDGVDLGTQNDLVSQALNSGVQERAARIEQLRALVASGQYQVDPSALSKSIVDATLNDY